MVAIDRACTFLDFFESSGYYAVNILREDQRDLSVRFAELPEGRFAGVAWRPGATGSPVLEGALSVIECRTIQVLDAGDHRMFIGEAIEVNIREGRPLVFFGSEYSELR
jgi:flavin reductase (DIM6/NTAB) family NADH-FMN oxidoreductase RutF